MYTFNVYGFQERDGKFAKFAEITRGEGEKTSKSRRIVSNKLES